MDGHDKTQERRHQSNVFDFYSARRKEQRSGGENGLEDSGYYACGVSITDGTKGDEEWFRIHGEIEGQYSSIELVRYRDVVKVYCPIPDLLCILCEDSIFTLKERDLDIITLHIQDRTLRALYLFDPGRFAEPGDDETVILRMEREDIVAGEE